MGIVDLAMTLGKMKVAQWKSTEELEQIQEEKLKSLVSHASRNVPYYRRSLENKHLKGFEHLSELPILMRKTLQAQPRMFIDQRLPIESLKEYRTSGSSGIPLSVYYNRHDAMYSAALRWHWFLENGFAPLDATVQLTYPRDGAVHMIQKLGIFKIRWAFMKNDAEKDMRALRALKPSILCAAPTYLAPVAKENLKSKKPLRLKKIFTYAEFLTPQLRELASSSFGCSISDRYGCIEAGSIAWECEKGNKHVYSDSIIVEIVDDEGQPVKKGQYGNILLTPLWRSCMPLIRYSIGDIAKWGSGCSCGRGYHVLSDLKGRHNPNITLPSGRLFSGTLLGAELRFVRDMLQFQVVQDSKTSLRLKAVLSKGSKMTRKELIDIILGTLPEPIDIEVEFLDSIPPNDMGKLCEFVSKI